MAAHLTVLHAPPNEIGQHGHHRVEVQPRQTPVGSHQGKRALVGCADVLTLDLVAVSLPDTRKELHPDVVEDRAQVERGGLGVQGRHPGHLDVDLVEQQVHAGVRHGVVQKVGRQRTERAQFPEHVHHIGQVLWRQPLAIAHPGIALRETIGDWLVMGDQQRLHVGRRADCA
jgi:hypothetical protein